MGFTFDGNQVRRNLRELEPKIDARISTVVEFQAARGEAKMKIDAPWTDRTGAARNGLFTRYGKRGSTHEILFSHSVAYGIWLEIIESGEWQVIWPTMRVIGRETMKQLDDLFGDIR
jgi:hypothetical protein